MKVLNRKAVGREGRDGVQVMREEEAEHMEVTFELLCLNISPMRLLKTIDTNSFTIFSYTDNNEEEKTQEVIINADNLFFICFYC